MPVAFLLKEVLIQLLLGDVTEQPGGWPPHSPTFKSDPVKPSFLAANKHSLSSTSKPSLHPGPLSLASYSLLSPKYIGR